jgi:hypothetical protein
MNLRFTAWKDKQAERFDRGALYSQVWSRGGVAATVIYAFNL